MRKLIFLCATLYCIASAGQEKPKLKTFDQKDFNAYKINPYTYDAWYRGIYNRDSDTIHYFVDPAEYKGVLNYGVDFSARDKRVVNYTEDFSVYFIDIAIDKCTFNSKDSIAEIDGSISGGWTIFDIKGAREAMKIIVGEKKDTLYEVRFGPQSYIPDSNYIVTYKNQVQEGQFILDTLPAFRMINHTYWRNIGDRKTFSIRCKVNKQSVLMFAEMSTYAEIFDLGRMFFDNPKKPGKTVPKRKKDDPRFVRIIQKNEQVKYRKPRKPDAPYYQLAEKAENYILSRQYGKAKETYFQISKEYPNLFAADLHNAIRVSILSRDLNAAQIWGEKLAMKGVNIKYFDAKIFNALKQSPMWRSFSAKFDSISKQSHLQFDHGLRQKFDELTAEDQADYGLDNRKESLVLYETTERVTEKLIDLLQTDGFPSEEKIGVLMKNDTVIWRFPEFNVLIRHAVQQEPKGLDRLMALLDKSFENLEYDKKRSSNHRGFPGVCLHVYKGNLYNDKSCSNNDIMIQRMIFKFNNPNGFILDYGDFIVSEYNYQNPEEWDKYYEEQFNFVVKLTDDWEFYEKD